MFGHTGHMSIWFPWAANSVPANAYVEEDNTAPYITEDGLSYYVAES